MRTIIYTFALLLTIMSCRSVEKMVEKGEYDKAFTFAISKLQGQSKKETKYVKALEKAYIKLNETDGRLIAQLKANSSKPENGDKTIDVYKRLEYRQLAIDPLIPLVSQDGYEAQFDIKDYSSKIKEVEDITCLYYYDNASSLLQKSAKTRNKSYARDAYYELEKIEKYRRNYKDSEALKDKALNAGLTSIYFDIKNDLRNFHGDAIEKMLYDMPVSKLDNLWEDYNIGGFDDGKNADYIVIIDLDVINFSPERERVNNYTESKEILIRTDKVIEKRDTVNVIVEKQVFEKVSANISEIFREKQADLHGKIKVFDNVNKKYLSTTPVNVFKDFKGYACKYVGDKRALTTASKGKLDNNCENFPADFNMASELSTAFRDAVMSEAKNIKYN